MAPNNIRSDFEDRCLHLKPEKMPDRKMQVRVQDYNGVFHDKSEHEKHYNWTYEHIQDVADIHEVIEIGRQCGDDEPIVIFPDGKHRHFRIGHSRPTAFTAEG